MLLTANIQYLYVYIYLKNKVYFVGYQYTIFDHLQWLTSFSFNHQQKIDNLWLSFLSLFKQLGQRMPNMLRVMNIEHFGKTDAFYQLMSIPTNTYKPPKLHSCFKII